MVREKIIEAGKMADVNVVEVSENHDSEDIDTPKVDDGQRSFLGGGISGIFPSLRPGELVKPRKMFDGNWVEVVKDDGDIRTLHNVGDISIEDAIQFEKDTSE